MGYRQGSSTLLEASQMERAVLPWARAADVGADDHVRSVARYSQRLAELAGLSAWEAELIGRASRLHDVGKIGVPPELLAKPGPLTEAERLEVRRHATIGHALLSGSGCLLLDVAATIALTHHERYDGSGYPRGLQGNQIPIEGRITAIADVFDALTSDRAYRPAMTARAAIELMRKERGLHFDPRLVDLFLESVSRAHSGT